MLSDKLNRAVVWTWVAMLMLTLLCLLIFSSCATQRVVTEIRERVMHDTTYQTVWRDRIDSVYVHDTTYVDTAGVVHHQRVESQKSKVESHDTVYKTVNVLQIDSVPYTVEVVKEVPRARSWYDKFTSWFFWVVVVILLLIGAFKICDKIPATKPYITAIKMFFKILK